MISTPWDDEPLPFDVAAETGTRRVITEHSTVGVLVTTDGSISSIPRSQYAESEERVVAELKRAGQTFRHRPQYDRSLFGGNAGAGRNDGGKI